jgi:hypothetical protein
MTVTLYGWCLLRPLLNRAQKTKDGQIDVLSPHQSCRAISVPIVAENSPSCVNAKAAQTHPEQRILNASAAPHDELDSASSAAVKFSF